MSQDQNPETMIWCECFICKGENPESGGKYVSKQVFKRHHKKESGWANIQNIIPDLEYFSNSRLNLNIEERQVF
jgi:hypothetical protein